MFAKHELVNSAAALTLAFGLAGCSESDIDIQRKPNLVDVLTDRAAATCSMQQSALDQAPYVSRLKEVLYKTDSKTLDFFNANRITICLDKRLSAQVEKPFFDESRTWKARGVYYPNEKILTLWDNGKTEAQKSLSDTSAAAMGPTFLRAFAKHTFGEGKMDFETLDAPLLAHHKSGGRRSSPNSSWRSTEKYPQPLSNTPTLQTPPIRAL